MGVSTNLQVSPERPRLLVVEDERVLCASIVAYFGAQGWEVEGAASLDEARRCLARTRFDAAILDVRLPDGDGLSLLRRTGTGRAVVVSAEPDPARYEAHGVRHQLPKPLDLIELERFVQRAADEP